MAPGLRQQGLLLAEFAWGNKIRSRMKLREGLTTNFHRDMAFQIA